MAANTSVAIIRRDLENALIQKCWKDQDFRQQVINDPKGMLERHLGQKLPPQLQIVVHEEDSNALHFTRPPAPQNLAELSDDDLEKVAGGTDVIIGTAILTLFGSAAMSAASVTALNKDKVGW